jgi:hypothetical protein
MSEQKIEIVYRPADVSIGGMSISLPNEPKHAFLLYTNSAGQQFSTDAYPSTPYGGFLIDSTGPAEKGYDSAFLNPTMQGTTRATLAAGPDLSETWQRIVSGASEINSILPFYEYAVQNSNSAAASEAMAAGLIIPSPGVFVPGLQNYILPDGPLSPLPGTIRGDQILTQGGQ